jgi:2,5-furandicarboxylate decarboxylase 1
VIVMITNLRSFIEILKEQGELIEIHREVDPIHEVTTIMRKLDVMEQPAVFFHKVKGYEIPIVGNLLGTLRRNAIALNTSPPESRSIITKALENPIPPIIIKQSPVKEIKYLNQDKIDLLKLLPVLTHTEQDGGPYITAGIWLVRDPESGRRNAAYVRTQVKGPTRCAILLGTWRHTADYFKKAEAMKKPLECSIALGVDPAIEIAAGVKAPNDELEIAGAIRNRPVHLIPGETVEVEAIADAEIVIEGHIPPNIREEEGPFGEFTGHATGVRQGPIFSVTGVFHRKQPIYRALYGGSNEHILLGNVIPREHALYEATRRMVPTVQSVHIAPYGAGYVGLISIKKQNEGEPKNAMIAAWTSHINLKYIIVVDHDVDIYNLKDVVWAIATRTQGQKSFVFIPDMLTNTVDPSRQEDGTTTKVGIDATTPLGGVEKQFQRLQFKGYDKLQLEEYTKVKPKQNE